jgi:uncharacterized protein (TIGR00730 family)
MDNIISPEKAYKDLDFLNSTDARSIRILSEYLEPLSRFKKLKVINTILFFGSARMSPSNETPLSKYYQEAEELAYRLTKWAAKLKPKEKHFVICTGGGGGIMEAANRGASRAGGKSIGMNISLPYEQHINPYISPELAFKFHYFFMRKFWLINMAKSIVAFPGGFGTLDEIFETLTLIQTRKISKEKTFILLYGEDYWREIVDFEALVKHGVILPEDLHLFKFSSDIDHAFNLLKKRLIKN